MLRRYTVLATGLILVLCLAACSEESSSPLSSMEPGSSPEVGEVPGNYGFELHLGVGVDSKTIASLVKQLPNHTLENADQVIVEYSPKADDDEYLVLAIWPTDDDIHTEIWNLSLAKRASKPLCTIYAVDEDSGRIDWGFDEKYIAVSQGAVEYCDPSKKVDMGMICEVTRYIEDAICPALSLIPYGSVVCAFVSVFNFTFCEGVPG